MPLFDLRQFIIDWNVKYPIDYAWRKKYNIPFGSPEHLTMDFISMKFDLEEQNLWEEVLGDNPQEFREVIKDSDIDKCGEEITKDAPDRDESRGMTKKEIDEAFDNINLDDYNDTSSKDEDTILLKNT